MFSPKCVRDGLAALALLTCSALPAYAETAAPPADCQGPPSKTWINVAVSGVRSSLGLVAVTLYADDQSRFLAHKGSMLVARVPARQGTTDACVFVPRPGVYALVVYHDENGNRKFDRTVVGMPAEGYGFSNNPETFMGLPAFTKVRVAIPKANLGTTIKLTYP